MSEPMDPLEIFSPGAGRSALTVLGPGGPEIVGFDAILERARAGARRLAALGVGPGNAVAVLGDASPWFHVAVLAAWGAGAACLPLPPPLPLESADRWAERSAGTLRAAGAMAVVTPAEAPGAALPVPVLPAESLLDGDGATPSAPGPDDPGLILLTSGSSDDPKGVVLSFRAVAARVRNELREGLCAGPDHIVTWLPPSFAGGFNQALLRPFAVGAAVTLLPATEFLKRPMRWLEAITEARGTVGGCGSFGFTMLAARLDRERPAGIDLASWERVWCSGERVDPDHVTRFLELAEPLGLRPETFLALYSLSEAGSVAQRGVLQGLAVDAVDARALADGVARPEEGGDGARFASNGPPLRSVELEIMGPDERALPERRVGEIRIRTPALLDRYLAESERTAGTLVDGWLWTGDLGYLADGELYITGRVKDVIIVHGRNHYAEDLERLAEAVPGLAPGTVAAVGLPMSGTESVAIVAETQLPAGPARDRARRDVARRLWSDAGVRPERVEFVAPGSLPRTRSGKLRREEVRRALVGDD